MGRPFQFQIDDRRQSVVHFLNEGLSPREIARKLGCRIEIIERDIKAIEADREVWDLVDRTGMDYSTLKERIRLQEEERPAEMKRLKAMEEKKREQIRSKLEEEKDKKKEKIEKEGLEKIKKLL